ncbi:MAG: DUF177 domain-containing protein [Proteobacteria bacterium]|nr:DUF177 domain-containing protein [Pseudomonadota bacterium]
MTVTPNPELEFSFPVDVTSLPPVGRHYAIAADEAARARVAVRLGLQDVRALTASFELMPRAGGLVKVTGSVEASVTQICVVTLAPLPATLREEVEVTFSTFPLKPAPQAKAGKGEDEDEDLLALGEDDPPEEALDGLVDLGELAVEYMALGLEPYPRAPGAAFEGTPWAGKGGKSEQESPFAVLAQLKKKEPPKGG